MAPLEVDALTQRGLPGAAGPVLLLPRVVLLGGLAPVGPPLRPGRVAAVARSRPGVRSRLVPEEV